VYDFYPRDTLLARVFAIATCPSVRGKIQRFSRRTDGHVAIAKTRASIVSRE